MWPFNASQRETKASRAQSIVALGQLGRPVWSPRDYAHLAAKGYASNPVVYRCVRMISESVASVPLYIFESGTSFEQHPLLQLLTAPNPRQASAAFFETLVGHLLIAGNAYVEAVKTEETVAELYALRPDRMKVVPGPEGWPQAYDYVAGGASLRFRQDEGGVPPILHLTLFHPTNDHYGLAPLEAAAIPLDILNSASAWHKALLDNSARPSGALVYAPASGATLSREQFERLKEELETSFQGSANAGRPLLLEGGLDWRPLSLSPKEMDFLEARNAAARDVALAFGVPPMLLGIPGDATYANYQEANKAFWRQSVLPLLGRITQSLSHWLQPAFGNVDLRYDSDAIPALDADRAALWKRVGEASFLSDDEKREAVGYTGKETKSLKANFNPAQPRVPAGNSEGGQWGDGGSGSSASRIPKPLPRPEWLDPPGKEEGLRSVYPLETAIVAAGSIAALPMRAAFGAARAFLGETVGNIESQLTIRKASQAVQKFLGGKPERVINNNGNYIIMRGDKKVRFDLKPRQGEPHFQLEVFGKDKFGKQDWIDAIPGRGNHRFKFKGKSR